ncbi:MAG TPA: hypothetical protein VFW47_15215 [Phenylobacterium sp.]|nr:hypothetical protein [Phenylobacterium sp.]
MSRTRTWVVLTCGLVLLGACATTDTGAGASKSTSGDQSPGLNPQEGGLGLMGGQTPDALRLIAKAPYAPPEPRDCTSLAASIGALDGLLGPDLDTPRPDERDAAVNRVIVGAFRGLIPHRWVFRMLTSASRKDRELRDALFAGVARRGYLRGLAEAGGCPPRVVAPPSPAPPAKPKP